MKYIKIFVFCILSVSLIISGLAYFRDKQRLENEKSVYFEHPVFEKAISIYNSRNVISNKKNVTNENEVFLFFDTYETGILNDLKKFTSLEYLKINCLSNEMLIEISAFPSIMQLELTSFNEEINFSHLAQLKSLKELIINGTLTETQMNDIMKLANITALSIRNGNIQKLELPPKLETLYLSDVLIEDGTLQVNLPDIKKLYLSDVYIVNGSELELLQRIEGVTELSIAHIKLSQMHFINELKYLQTLKLLNIGTTDIASIDISLLPQLEQIQFSEDIYMDSESHIQYMKKIISERIELLRQGE